MKNEINDFYQTKIGNLKYQISHLFINLSISNERMKGIGGQIGQQPAGGGAHLLNHCEQDQDMLRCSRRREQLYQRWKVANCFTTLKTTISK